MYLVAFDKSGRQIGHKLMCHGCGTQSPLFKSLDKLPRRWEQKLEAQYTDNGNMVRSYRRGLVTNYYCGCCAGKCSAYTVAATMKKLSRQRRRNERSNIAV